MSAPYTAPERRALERALAGERPACPRCDAPLERRDVPPKREVAYVRDRVWVICTGCGATAVVDRRDVERARGVPPRPAGG